MKKLILLVVIICTYAFAGKVTFSEDSATKSINNEYSFVLDTSDEMKSEAGRRRGKGQRGRRRGGGGLR